MDVLNSNRQLWHSAFGPDPEALGNPTEGLLEQCNRSVVVLHAMLEKHGPRGGLDSHVQDVTSAVKMLKVVSWDAIRKDRFSLTPQASSVQLVFVWRWVPKIPFVVHPCVAVVRAGNLRRSRKKHAEDFVELVRRRYKKTEQDASPAL